MEEQLNELVMNEEYNYAMHDCIRDSEMGEWLKEDIVARIENADDLDPEHLVPLAIEYANNYVEEFQAYEIFSDVPSEAFKTWFTWSLANYMKECINKYNARIDAYNASQDIEDRWEREHTYDRVYEDRADRPLYKDEMLDLILASQKEDSMQLR
ncbi:MAG: hypothetical protein II625_04070 [Bacilli bacterium]|nr:hypothetical protein [Bacilli bacterium]